MWWKSQNKGWSRRDQALDAWFKISPVMSQQLEIHLQQYGFFPGRRTVRNPGPVVHHALLCSLDLSLTNSKCSSLAAFPYTTSAIPLFSPPTPLLWVSNDSLLNFLNLFPIWNTHLSQDTMSTVTLCLLDRIRKFTALKDENIRFPELLECFLITCIDCLLKCCINCLQVFLAAGCLHTSSFILVSQNLNLAKCLPNCRHSMSVYWNEKLGVRLTTSCLK